MQMTHTHAKRNVQLGKHTHNFLKVVLLLAGNKAYSRKQFYSIFLKQKVE